MRLIVKNILPEIYDNIEQTIIDKKINLSSPLDNLEITGLCECESEDCGSFYTDSIRDDEIETDHFTLNGNEYVIHIYKGNIHYVEGLPGEKGKSIRDHISILLKEE